MKRAVIGGLLCVVGLAGPAIAADLKAKGPVAAAAPAWSWGGSYIGLHGGYAWGNDDHAFAPLSGFAPAAGGAFSQDLDGGLFGFQTGFNWQIGNVVFGLEGTTSWTSIEGKDAGVFGGAFAGASYKTEVEDLSTFTARLGFANGPWLLYGKGGVAYGEVKSTFTNGAQYFREHNDHIGWTAGVGVEYALTPSWIIGLEYNYVDLGDQRYGGLLPTFADYKADISFSTMLARVSYKFGAGGNPITAAILGPPNPNGPWNGLYLGINGGYGWGTSEQDIGQVGPVLAGKYDYDASGGVFGGHIGYFSQIGNWVIGTEASFDWTGLKETESVPSALLGVATAAASTTELNWVASTTLRVGYSWGPWLLYGKGGGAFGEVDSTYTATAGGVTRTFNETNDHVGWTIGGGLEYAWGNWLAGIEYNYYDLGDQKYGGFTDAGNNLVSYKSDLTFSTVLARLSYKFAAPTPVIAKY
jgi:outer membrane immunogenic protein